MTAITTVTPSRLSPIAQGTLTITGTGLTGYTGGTLEGRALTDFVVISDTQITATWPLRMTKGRYFFDQADVTLSLTDGTNTVTSTVAYVAPVNLRCAQHLEDALAAGTTADKYFFNWSQPQVIRGKFDVSTRAINGAYPIGVVWIEDEQYIESESTGNLRVYDMPFGMGALMPLRDGLEPTAQAALMVADLVRAAFMDISQGKNALSTDVNEKNYDVFPTETGSYIGANIRGMIRYQHVAQDSTQEVFWQNTQF
jgi:hypothetical protein